VLLFNLVIFFMVSTVIEEGEAEVTQGIAPPFPFVSNSIVVSVKNQRKSANSL
jgi:hypothetical protein